MRGRSSSRRVRQIGGSGYGEILLVFLFTVVGLLLAIRRPRNPIGWLFLSSGVCFVLSAFATSYSILDYVHDHGSLPLGWVSLLFAEFWAPAIVLLSVAALLFPDGRPSSRTMRLLLVALLLAAFVWQGGAFGIAVSAIVTHKIHIDSGGDLYAIDHAVGPWAWRYAAAQPAFFITVAAVWLGWLLQQVPAYRRSSRDPASPAQVALRRGGAVRHRRHSHRSVHRRLAGAAARPRRLRRRASLRVAAERRHRAVEVPPLRHRQGDQPDRVLCTPHRARRRPVRGGGHPLHQGLGFSSPVAVAASTLVAAALFNPLRKRLQRVVDRRFNRARYDAEATVAAFTARLRDAVDLETVRTELLEVVNRAVEPAHASVWIRRRE